MSSYQCPSCKARLGNNLIIKHSAGNPKWYAYKKYQPSLYKIYCPDCSVEIKFDIRVQWWGVILTQVAVMFAALWFFLRKYYSGNFEILLYGALLTAVIGTVMLLIKVQLEVAGPPSDKPSD